MLEAYMDESGIHDGAHVCVIAGYYGGESQWRRFEPRWQKIIEDADTPALKEFHARDFWVELRMVGACRHTKIGEMQKLTNLSPTY
jgi:hypothetical protein